MANPFWWLQNLSQAFITIHVSFCVPDSWLMLVLPTYVCTSITHHNKVFPSLSSMVNVVYALKSWPALAPLLYICYHTYVLSLWQNNISKPLHTHVWMRKKSDMQLQSYLNSAKYYWKITFCPQMLFPPTILSCSVLRILFHHDVKIEKEHHCSR